MLWADGMSAAQSRKALFGELQRYAVPRMVLQVWPARPFIVSEEGGNGLNGAWEAEPWGGEGETRSCANREILGRPGRGHGNLTHASCGA